MKHFKKFDVNYFVDEEHTDSVYCSCDPDDYCRCGVIQNAKVVQNHKLKTLSVSNISFNNQYIPEEIENYCLTRLMSIHRCFDATSYIVNVSDGYYGEEITSITLIKETDFENDINHLLTLKSNHEKIMFVLKKEYGYIANLISDTTTCSTIELPLSYINCSSGYKLMTKKVDYCYDINENEIIGILFNNIIVDGNNRFKMAKQSYNEETKFKFLILE